MGRLWQQVNHLLDAPRVIGDPGFHGWRALAVKYDAKKSKRP
jgi:hypothetical protein